MQRSLSLPRVGEEAERSSSSALAIWPSLPDLSSTLLLPPSTLDQRNDNNGSSSNDDEGSTTMLVPAVFETRPSSNNILTISDGLHRAQFIAALVSDDDEMRRDLLSIDLYEDFSVYHRCLAVNDDPFVGLVQQEDAACCAMRAFLDLAHGTFDEHARRLPRKPSFTAYGEQLQRINALVYEIDIRILLHDHWKLKGNLLGPEPLYEFLSELIPAHFDDDHVEWLFASCSVCFAQCRYVRKTPCCRTAICQECWTTYVKQYAKTSLALNLNGMYNLRCFSCSLLVPYSQALVATNPSEMQLIRPHLTSTSRCPVCLKQAPPSSKEHQLKQPENERDVAETMKKRRKKGGHPVTCDRCGHVYCVICGTSNHPKLSCQQLTGSDVGLRKWTREKSAARPDFPNGRFCPVCHIPVSHSGGCPQMTCPCGTSWCYSCGREYCKSFPYLLPGHKTSRYIPIISCPKLWKSQSKRIVVHTIIGLGIVVGIGPLALAVSPLVIPAAVGYYMIERSRRRRR